MLFTLGGMFSLYEGFHKLMHPEALDTGKLWWAVGVLVFAIVAESVSMRACMPEVNKARANRSLWRWFHQSRQAELVVIFGEDLAALLGLSFALVAVLLTILTGNPLWDALGTIAIGALLLVIAVFVAIEVKAMRVGQSVDPELQAQIRAFYEQRPEVARVIHLITLQLGNDVMVSVQASMKQREHVPALLEDMTRIERALKAEFPVVRWSFFEPETAR